MISRGPTHHQVTDAKDAAELVGDYETFTLAKSVIRDRTIYRRAAGLGQGVIEFAETNDKATQDIEAANKLPATESYPWIGQDDKKRRSGFNMRFTDAELQKLKFISENTPHSMHEFCIRVLTPAIDAKIAELTQQKG